MGEVLFSRALTSMTSNSSLFNLVVGLTSGSPDCPSSPKLTAAVLPNLGDDSNTGDAAASSLSPVSSLTSYSVSCGRSVLNGSRGATTGSCFGRTVCATPAEVGRLSDRRLERRYTPPVTLICAREDKKIIGEQERASEQESQLGTHDDEDSCAQAEHDSAHVL